MVKSKRAREAVEAEEKPVAVEHQTEAPAKKRKRSDDEPASGDVKKKAKKDKKKDKKESRKERKEKRKDLLNLPEEEADEDEQPETAAPEKMDVDATAATTEEPKKEKKQKKDKKEKKSKDKEEKTEGADEEEPKKEKKEKKDKKDKKDKKKKDKKNKTAETEQNGDAKPTEEDKANGAEEEGEEGGKADRHIVFVGNLPYSATAASITAHFASLSPVSVRCLTKREDPKACRGIAFVEFGKVWHMRTCLDKFHHSMFDDGVSPARKINVELTAGGGGKTQQRSEKIKEKNRKLDENRAKRIEKEKTAKEENKNGAAAQQEESQDYIHPSRRARVPGQRW